MIEAILEQSCQLETFLFNHSSDKNNSKNKSNRKIVVK